MSERVRYEERMSESDALLWNNERDPMLRSTITSVMILEGPPDPERFAGAVARSLEKIPRLRQRVVLDALGAAPPRWERDPLFDLGYHWRRVRVAGEGSLRDLLDLAQPIAMQAFDKDRPLWELHQVDGLADGRTAILIKLHHSVSDGVGLVRMTSSLVERSPDPRPPRSGSPAASLLEEPGPRGAFEETLRAPRAPCAAARCGRCATRSARPATRGAWPARSAACCGPSRSRSRRCCAGAPSPCASTRSSSPSRT
jgi:hypothetical protein